MNRVSLDCFSETGKCVSVWCKYSMNILKLKGWALSINHLKKGKRKTMARLNKTMSHKAAHEIMDFLGKIKNSAFMKSHNCYIEILYLGI